MCGRYFIRDKLIEEIKKMIPELLDESSYTVEGDVAPSMTAPVILGSDGRPVLTEMVWGFPRYDGKGLIINARAETAAGKPTFSDSMKHRRVLIPMSGFYEWDRAKNKASFTLDEKPVFFLAGFYNAFGGDKANRYVIMTTAANDSMLKVHDRMPLIIDLKNVREWLFEPEKADSLCREIMPDLTKTFENEQLSLF